MKTICSKKCAKPGISGGSLKLPTPIDKAAAALNKTRIECNKFLLESDKK